MPRSAVLITIDSLRYDRLTCTGGTKNCTPTIDSLIQNGEWYPRAYANSWYTQFSFPSIFTSTQPLDFGGYDVGIVHRPQTLAAALREHGLRTAGFSTDPYLNAYYGYERGFESFFELFDLSALWEHVARDYIAHYSRAADQGTISHDTLQQRVQHIVDRLLRYATGYCERKLHPADDALRKARSPLFRQDFTALLGKVRREREAFDENPAAFVDALIRSPEVVLANSENAEVRPHGFRDRLLEAIGGYPPKLHQPTVDARAVVSLASAWLGKQDDAPSFVWLSLNDVHDLNFTHWAWSRSTLEFHRQSRSTADELRLKHDLALRFVDDAIRRLLDTLRRLNRLESTMVVICADHGRLVESTPFTGMFADALIRVPLLVWNAGRSSGLSAHPCSLKDIAPTILERLGLPACAEFQGEALQSAAALARPHVVVEQLGAGPGNLGGREPLICLVGRDYKYAWSPDGRDWLNDLSQHPRRGFVPCDPDSPLVQSLRLRTAAQERYDQIRATRTHSASMP